MPARGGTVRLQIPSNFELLDVIQVASDRLAVTGRPRRRRDSLDRRRGARVGHQRDQARQPRGLRQARDHRVLDLACRPPPPSSSSGWSTKEKASSRRKSPIRSRRRTSSSRAAAGSSSCAASWTTSCCGARPKAAWKCAWSRSSPPVPEPSPRLSRHRRSKPSSTPATCRCRASAPPCRSRKRARSISSPRPIARSSASSAR